MPPQAQATALPNSLVRHPGADDAALGRDALCALLLLTPDCTVVNANPAGERLLFKIDGKERTNHLLTAVHPDDRALAAIIITRAITTGTTQSCEIRLDAAYDAEGSVWWLQAARPSTGTEPLALVQLQNIDTFKGPEAALSLTVERLNSALVNSMLGVWDHNYRTGDFFYSDIWRKLRGIAPGENVDADFESWIEGVHPDDRDNVTDVINRQMAGEIHYSQFEYRERHRDGHWVWIECRGSSVEWDADGNATRIIGTDTEVTPRKEAEARLAAVTRRLELALEVGQIGVFEVDFVAGYNLWDDRMLAIYGEPPERRIQAASRWESMLHPDDAEAAIKRVADHVALGKPFTNQFRIIRPDGVERHVRARILPIKTGDKITGVIGANWDVTDDVRVHEELARAKSLAEARNVELEATKARIEHDALHDFLTDLPNRRYLDNRLADFKQHCIEAGQSIAVMHLDLDRFKQINDTLGHQAGDEVLKHAASVMRANSGPDDFIARIGGDEFVILTGFDGSAQSLSKRAERIIRKMCEPIKADGNICRVGASIGIAHSRADSSDVGRLLLNADIALYRAKSLGRNRFEFFNSEIRTEILTTRKLSDEILIALEQRQFVPFYQLQFHAGTLDVAGVETLARWQHPERGILTPDRFMSVAEDLDVVSSIDALMLDQALADLERWKAAGIAIPKISVNVSARRLSDRSFAAKLGELAITPGEVSFELLESIFLDEYDAVVNANLEAMRQKGIRIEIDDFGTGHASVVSLLRIAPGTFKIDRALISPIVEHRDQRKLVGSIIEIGRSLNIKVVAEGVETREHARILRFLGCDILQGFALARPMPFADIMPFLATGCWRG